LKLVFLCNDGGSQGGGCITAAPGAAVAAAVAAAAPAGGQDRSRPQDCSKGTTNKGTSRRSQSSGGKKGKGGGFDVAKWATAGAAALWVNYSRSGLAAVFFGGCVANSFAAKVLKRVLNQPRPKGAEEQGLPDPGTPS
jgi:hypothetical protein